jgi:hypothetical protein
VWYLEGCRDPTNIERKAKMNINKNKDIVKIKEKYGEMKEKCAGAIKCCYRVANGGLAVKFSLLSLACSGCRRMG